MLMPKLSDNQAYDRLHAAGESLPEPDECETEHARTAVATARRALAAILLGLLTTSEKRASEAPPPPD